MRHIRDQGAQTGVLSTLDLDADSLVAKAKAEWEVCEIALVHRLGRVDLEEASVAIAVSSPSSSENTALPKTANQKKSQLKTINQLKRRSKMT